MKTFYGAIILTVFSWFHIAASVLAADINGLWTKTTSADLNNITTFYSENRKVRAIGYSSLPDKKNVWYATGEINGSRIQLSYHYSEGTAPSGWELDGKMNLIISKDGNIISGIATSISGKWSGKIEFKRVQTVSLTIE